MCNKMYSASNDMNLVKDKLLSHASLMVNLTPHNIDIPDFNMVIETSGYVFRREIIYELVGYLPNTLIMEVDRSVNHFGSSFDVKSEGGDVIINSKGFNTEYPYSDTLNIVPLNLLNTIGYPAISPKSEGFSVVRVNGSIKSTKELLGNLELLESGLLVDYKTPYSTPVYSSTLSGNFYILDSKHDIKYYLVLSSIPGSKNLTGCPFIFKSCTFYNNKLYAILDRRYTYIAGRGSANDLLGFADSVWATGRLKSPGNPKHGGTAPTFYGANN